jgi:hypothetical protein
MKGCIIMTFNIEKTKLMIKNLIFNTYKDIEEFTVENKEDWINESNIEYALKYISFYGTTFKYFDGKVILSKLSEEEYSRKAKLREKVTKQHFIDKKDKTENEKINNLLKELSGFKEINHSFPYYPKGADIVIFMSPKDKPTKDWNDIEECDLLIYDRDFEEYFIAKRVENGFKEIFCNNVNCRTFLSNGGYMVRVREKCIVAFDDDQIFILPSETEIKEKFTKKELEEAHQMFFGDFKL